ncbi:MAG TPA: sugar transferase [Candidatus Paceibacterota bacterium]|jgi:lipopolysaccharide/colanic/teichoic acid biosynthesis glycosyltransferase
MVSARRETAFLLAGDVLLLVISLWLALAARNLSAPSSDYFYSHVYAFVPVFAAALLIFFIAGLYERQTRLVKRVLGVRILGAQLAGTLLAAVFFFVLPFAIAPKTILALYMAISVALISVWRFFVVPYLSLAGREHALLVGTGPLVETVLREVNDQPKYYIQFDAHIDTGTLVPGELCRRVKRAVDEGVRFVVIDTRNEDVRAELPALYELMVSGVSFSEFATFYEGLFDKVPVDHIDHAWILECLPKRNVLYSSLKRVIDIAGSLVGIVFAAPFVVIAAVLLVFERGSPFVFHERIGAGGRRFNIVKLRSMLINDHGDPELQKQNRVTGLGKFLRKTRIDELPQLWNILRGDLSFIGPRPELPKIAEVYEHEIPYYGIRHLIAPGLSGWAQIYDYDAPRGGADVERTRRKLSYDLYYLKNRSFALDMAIALKTLRALASFSGT